MSRRAGVLVVPVAFFALVPGAAWVGGASAAPVPKHLMKAAPHYFPTRVGTKWVYTRYGRDETHSISKVVEMENETLVTVVNVGKDGKTTPCKVMSVRPDGLYMVSESGEAYDPPWLILKRPAAVGQDWETKTTRAGLGPIEGKRTVAAEERLKVPAGEFLALRLEWQEPGAGGERPKTLHWYAPNVGIVQIDKDPPHLVLKSFTPGKE